MRWLLKGTLLLCVLLLLSGVGVVGYFMQDAKALVAAGEAWAARELGLDLKVGKAEMSSWRRFPDVQLSLKDFTVIHPDDSSSIIELGELSFELEVIDFWQKQFQLNQVCLHDGLLAVEGNGQLLKQLRKVTKRWGQTTDDPERLKAQVNQVLQVQLEEMQLVYRDTIRRKHMEGTAHKLDAAIHKAGNKSVAIQAEADLQIDQLTFNPDKGSYLSATHLQMQPLIHVSEGVVEFAPFDLHLNEECFAAEVRLDLREEGRFTLTLGSEQVNFAPTIRMVPQVLQEKLAPYHIAQPLAAQIKVDGAFTAGDNPLARIDFATSGNSFQIKDFPALRGVNATGYLINRVAQDSTRWPTEHRLNLRLHFDAVQAQLNSAKLQFQDCEITSTPDDRLHVSGQLAAAGPLAALRPFLEQSPWVLEGESFSFKTAFDGPFLAVTDILPALQNPTLEVRAARFGSRNSDDRMGIEKLRLALRSDSLLLPLARLQLPHKGAKITLSGHLYPYQPLFYATAQEAMSSRLHIASPSLRWQEIEDLLVDNASSQQKDTTNWSQLLQQIQQDYNPTLSLAIDHFQYGAEAVKQLQSALVLEADGAIQVQKASAKIDNSELLLAGHIRPKASTFDWDVSIAAQGNTAWFNRLFANNTFFFEGGHYQFTGHLKGNILEKKDLYKQTRGELHVQHAAVFLGPTEVRLPLEALAVSYDGDHLQVDELRLPLEHGDRVRLQGEVRYFRTLLSPEEEPSQPVSSFQLHAGQMYFRDLQNIFSSVQQMAEGQPAPTRQALKPSLQTLFKKFHPCLELEVDTFFFSQFSSTRNTAHLSFIDENHLAFNTTGFEFKGRPVLLSAMVDIEDEKETPFELELETERFDLGALVETYDYFGLEPLQRAERVAGKVSLKAQLQGKFIDSIGLKKDQLLGSVQFDVHEAELVNFAPIQEVANKFFRRERLHTIRFAPITDTLTITHKVVHIPRMEVQSTAFNLFVEGHLNYDNNTNIWVSLPWQNLRKWEEGKLPEKTGFAESGGKIFVEISDQEGEMKYRLRLRNKRLYEHRGIPDQFRIDRRKERACRRAYREQRRAARRAGV